MPLEQGFFRPCPRGGMSRRLPGPAVARANKITGWLKRTSFAVLLLALPGSLPAAAELKFGVFPQLSPRVMAETYQPVAEYLGESIGRPVSLESAPDFFTFHTRTVAQEYDLVLTAPHLAWLAWKEGGYRPILIYKEPVKGLVVVRADSPCRQLADLRGKTIAIPDPNAVVNLRMAKIFANAGLGLGRELAVTEVGSHTNAAAYASEGRSDAAIVGLIPFLRLSKEARDNLRVIVETPALPSLVFLVSPGTTVEGERTITRAMEKFMRDEPGRAFLRKTGVGGVRAMKAHELRQVEGDALELKQRFRVQEHSGKAN